MADSPAEPRPIAEISHGPSASEQFLEKNQKLLIIIAILLAIVAAGIVIKRGMDDAANLAAGAALTDATDIAAMQDVTKNHANTPTAASAAVLLSDLQWEQGQQSAALETLKAAIAAHPDHPATVPARARLAARLREQGDSAGAKELFKALADDPGASWIAPYALVSLAEIAREEGDAAQTRSLIEDANTRDTQGYFSNTASRLGRFVEFQAPVEIDPPADETPSDPVDPGTGELTPGSSDGPSNPLLDALNNPGTGDTTESTPEDSGDAAPADEPEAAADPSGETEPAAEDPAPAGE